MQPQLLPLAALAATVSAHGYISSPYMRAPGNATTAACGQSIVAAIVADKTSHVEGLPELGAAAGSGYHAESCNLWLCRGVQFADNVAHVQKYTPGQSVNIQVALTIPHVGSANVSVVDTRTNEIVGEPLLSWPSGYADEQAFYAGETPVNQTDFNVTIPTTLGSQCADAGACVLQWWWYGTGAKQTYESCVDFTVAAA
ncbi:Uu.00g005120.m01.CDS01 [Anthostomella pinea]|uniref:Uu.00g005120.m01.CDS01 n=1 Tax=Anthostomella pinea TaxID=933095 RepID=A0AAI8VKP7_9PEZI|nr:Uu.00g005120.m01.CDS01 [Anthostomella pinea]